METRVVAAPHARLSVAEAGAGGRPLLLLHGFTGSKEDFGEWLDPLAAAGWHVVAPDHRGHGESDHPAGVEAYSMPILAADAGGLADQLGWDHFAVLGHSMGGMVAQLLVLADPGRCDALILMDTFHGPLTVLDPALVGAVGDLVAAQGMAGLAALADGQASPLDTPAHQRLLEERPGYAEFGQRKLLATSPDLFRAISAEFLTVPDTLERLAALPPALPALVVVGEQDKNLLAPAEHMAAALASATLAVIPDAGHSPQFENPDAWWAAVSGFLASVAGTPGA